MKIPRYLRFGNFLVKPGNNLELSEILLLDIASAPVTLTAVANKTPLAGSLTMLSDGSASGVCSFSNRDARRLLIDYDRGNANPLSLSKVLLGTGSSEDTFPLGFSIYGSDDGITYTALKLYTDYYNIKKLKFPGPFAIQTVDTLSAFDKSYNFDVTREIAGYIQRNSKRQTVYNRTHSGYPAHARSLHCAPLRSGKWYLEIAGREAMFGIVGRADEVPIGTNVGTIVGVTATNTGIGYTGQSVLSTRNGVNGDAMPALFRANTEIEFARPFGVCVDLDALTMTLRRNNTTHTETIGIKPSPTGEYYPAISTSAVSMPQSMVLNMGEVPFENTVPAGYTPLIEYKAAIFAYEELAAPHDKSRILRLYEKKMSKHGLPFKHLLKLRTSPIVLAPDKVGYIKGTVFIEGAPDLPVQRFVTLMDSKSKLVLACTWSNPLTGTYQFDHIDMTRKYFTWTYDPSGLLPPTITGPMDPVVMPIYA